MGSYKSFVPDFIDRTEKNLQHIEQHAHSGQVYEFTQLINSLLGLIVLPREEHLPQIPAYPLSDLSGLGWPPFDIHDPFGKCKTLRDLIELLRNGVSHFNVEVIQDSTVQGVTFWNESKRGGLRNWSIMFSVHELKQFTTKLIEELRTLGDFQDETLVK